MHEATWRMDPDVAEKWWKLCTRMARMLDQAAAERNWLYKAVTSLQERDDVLAREMHLLRRDLSTVAQAGATRVILPSTSPNLLRMMLDSNKALYMFGGQRPWKDTTVGVEAAAAFRPFLPEMIDLPQVPGLRSTATAAALGRSIYILGGAINEGWVSAATRWDLDTFQYTDVCPMPTPHGGCGAAVSGDKIYAVGGLMEATATRFCDVFDPETNQWMPMAPLNRMRYNCSLSTLGGSLYCAGGYDSQVYLSTMERIDPREGKVWTEVDSMKAKRGALTLEIIGEHQLMAIAGWGNDERSGHQIGSMQTTEIYDVRVNAWQPGPTLNQARAFAASGVIDGRVYVLGGMGVNEGTPNIVEVWEPGALEWNSFPAPSTHFGSSRAFTAHAVL
eukprot:jgi/Botrbrau1/8594/Bobra.0380s0015.1